MSEHWGYHLMVDCSNCNDNVKDQKTIIAFAKQLVKDIDMVAYGEPQVPYFAAHDPSKAGHSLNQFIETSNITGHFIDANNHIYLDVFSCKEFDPSIVIETLKQFFGTDLYFKPLFLTRQAGCFK